MFIANFFKKKQVLETENNTTTYLKVEFMTQEEKVKKDIALNKVSKMYQDIEEDIIVNKDNQYKASFRQTFPFQNRSKIRISELLEIFQGGVQFPEVYDFMNTEVDTIQLLMYRQNSIQPDDFVPLLDIEQQLQNDDNKVLEIIYKRTSIFKRIKIGAKKAVLSLPRLVLNLIMKFIQFILGLMGLNSATGIGYTVAKSLIGTKTILTSLLSVISIFFPILAPFAIFTKFV